MKRNHQYILGGTLALLAIASTAVAASYITRESMETKPVEQARVTREYKPTNYVAAEPVRQPCNDHNIVGTVGGAAAGGLIGSRFGSGNGQTIATTVGILGGAAAGNKYIPTHGATCE